MGATFSSSKSPTYIYPATQSSNPPTRIYRIEVYKICRLVKQLNEDERKPTGVRVIIKINSMQISDHSASFDIPYPPSVYQKNPSELRLRPMLLNTKTSITSLRSAIFKSDTIAQSIVNHPQQPLKVDRPGLEKVKTSLLLLMLLSTRFAALLPWNVQLLEAKVPQHLLIFHRPSA